MYPRMFFDKPSNPSLSSSFLSLLSSEEVLSDWVSFEPSSGKSDCDSDSVCVSSDSLDSDWLVVALSLD